MGHTNGQARAETDASLPVALPPGRTFAALLVLIAIVSAAGLAMDGPAGGVPAVEPSPVAEQSPPSMAGAPRPRPTTPKLSRAAAVRIFTSLRQALNRAVRRRDARGVAAATTSAGSVGARAGEVVRSLRTERVLDLTAIESLSVRLVRSRAGTAVIRERVRLQPCLRTDDGRDITSAPGAFAQTILWRMRHTGGRWRLHRAEIAADRVLSDADARCP